MTVFLKKVVLDTNTLISGLLWDGNEARILEKSERKEIHLFVSMGILDELEGVLVI
ncbi:MAG: putative toxin-antitoxin system toxin component, PIN family [Syntrophobacterales bacterium CG_4_8_14_3_um_filter_49_14]|nr:MAG: putative toxin-antitoxin system toxin component, PIN family [Syntrophobacterales bacterium CG23_combo_of_CG06-09_8_20_14_all_48_27]PJC76563.1 MAG: putative toxin-antitoxin system toxin component, PIN family [Syntrophobacterales bacterium CG_4_8_14_3_um_filter_49_14]